MFRNLFIIAALLLVVALPFVFRQEAPAGDWVKGDPVLVVVSPHTEAIRYEFAVAFSRWHHQTYGKPVKIDWRSVGGTTEIVRYLTSEYTASARGWWQNQDKEWPAAATDRVFSRDADKNDPIVKAVRDTDDPAKVTCGIDVFFGGGQFDHDDVYKRGMAVAPWPSGKEPAGLFQSPEGVELIPKEMSGEIWRTEYMFGTALSTFGIVANLDRLKELNAQPPTRWDDLADPRFFRAVGVADPTKSGSIAKVFEMIIHQKVYQRVLRDGFTDEQINRFEKLVERKQAFPESEKYQQAISDGWLDGVRLVQLIGANARYFTDAGSKVPIDVSLGDAAVGMSIDFYGRYQAQESLSPDGQPRMIYVTPVGGSSVSCDPVSLLRGAPHRELAERFIEFALREEGQRLWNYRVGSPGGPGKFALRRLPIRRDFYPSTQPAIHANAMRHAQYAVDPITDPRTNAYELAKEFVYHRRWTGRLFGMQRELIRAMCMDSGDELRSAWDAIRQAGGPTRVPQAVAKLQEMPTVTLFHLQTEKTQPVPITWSTAPTFRKENYRPMDYTREWTEAFRANYRAAEQLAKEGK